MLNYPGRQDRVSLRLPNVNLLLGGNGSGKSSVFKALALSILSDTLASSGFRPYYLVRRTGGEPEQTEASSGRIAEITAALKFHSPFDGKEDHGFDTHCQISIEGDEEYLLEAQNGDKNRSLRRLMSQDSPALFLVGYGANRRVARRDGFSESANERDRSTRYQRVATLFEDAIPLVPIEWWWSQARTRERHVEATDLVNALLADEEVRFTPEEDEPRFTTGGVSLPFEALSDGFRGMLAWIFDLLHHLARVAPKDVNMVDLPGVVIVDEIDLLLHPEWQRTVIERLSTTFPKLQFLFSTHSPLVAGTLEALNIYVLDRDHNGIPMVDQYQENIYGLTANQVLTSSYFGLASTRAPGTGTLSDLGKLALSGKPSDQDEFVRRMMESIPAE